MAACYKCDRACVSKDDKSSLFGYPCDLCCKTICAECAGIAPSEIRVLVLKSRALFHICPDCNNTVIKNIMDQSIKVENLEKEFKKLKDSQFNHNLEHKKKIKALEDNIKTLATSTANVDDLANKVKVIENQVKCNKVLDCNPEVMLENAFSTTIDKHFKDMTLAMEKMSTSITEENSKLMKCLVDSNKKKINENASTKNTGTALGTAGTSTGRPVSNSQVANAVTLAEMQMNLNNCINLESDKESETRLFSDPKNRGKQVIKGTNKNITELSAAEDCRSIYIGNLNPDSTEDQLKQYLRSNNINVISCSKLTSRSHPSASFKVTVSQNLESLLYDSMLWPEKVTVKPFVFQKSGRPYDNSRGFQNFRRRPFSRHRLD